MIIEYYLKLKREHVYNLTVEHIFGLVKSHNSELLVHESYPMIESFSILEFCCSEFMKKYYDNTISVGISYNSITKKPTCYIEYDYNHVSSTSLYDRIKERRVKYCAYCGKKIDMICIGMINKEIYRKYNRYNLVSAHTELIQSDKK